jgi:hypothetical protein
LNQAHPLAIISHVIDRREFLQVGLAAAAALPFAALHASRASAAPAALYKAIFDERFPAGRAFAVDSKRRGVATHAIRGDVTALWYHDLYYTWRNGPAPIAGVTRAESLFCLEVLARDAGMRVVRRRELEDDLVEWVIG